MYFSLSLNISVEIDVVRLLTQIKINEELCSTWLSHSFSVILNYWFVNYTIELYFLLFIRISIEGWNKFPNFCWVHWTEQNDRSKFCTARKRANHRVRLGKPQKNSFLVARSPRGGGGKCLASKKKERFWLFFILITIVNKRYFILRFS